MNTSGEAALSLDDGRTLHEDVLQALQRLPSTATFEDIIDCVVFINSIRRGIEQVQHGEVVPHEEVMRRLGR